jgi:hypothetical protein
MKISTQKVKKSPHIAQSYEVNQLITTGDEMFINYAERIKSACQAAYINSENENEEYNIFTDLERRAVELEEIETREQKLKFSKIQKSLKSNYLNIIKI